ncbi:hypothetical protein [Gallionella capsiferriformans]|jgi:hypothetical protein|nr:hypothetical protein [Gallionella capsiferriformans]
MQVIPLRMRSSNALADCVSDVKKPAGAGFFNADACLVFAEQL